VPRSAEQAVAALVVLMVTLAACAGGSDRPASPEGGDSSLATAGDASNRTELAAVKRRLAALPAVIRVDGGYSHDPSNAGGDVVLAITVRPGADLTAVADDAVRHVWLSRLTPVASMTAAVGPDDDPSATVYRHADFDDSRASLAARYGSRPVAR